MPESAPSDRTPSNLEQVLHRIDAACPAEGRLSLQTLLEAIGRRAFGVWILISGAVILAPGLGDIPGVPTVMAILVALTAMQLMMRRDQLWLPAWLVRRSVASSKVSRAVRWMRRPARFIDRFLQPRLTAAVDHGAALGIALGCLVVALLMPAMELIPFSANGGGAALMAFGLALTTRDGVVALLGYLLVAAIAGIVIYALL